MHPKMNLIINDKPFDCANRSSLKQIITKGLSDEELDIVIEENSEQNYFLQIFCEDKRISMQYLGLEHELTYSALALDSNEIIEMIDSFMSQNSKWESMVEWKKKKRKHLQDPHSFYAKLSSLQAVIILIVSWIPLALTFLVTYKRPNSIIVNSVAWDFVWLFAFSIASIGGYIDWRHARYIRLRNNVSWYADIGELKALIYTIGFAIMGFIPIIVRVFK
jgi:hypothetical protein